MRIERDAFDETTTIRLFDPYGRRGLAFGEPVRVAETSAGLVASFAPGTVVAYVVEHRPRGAVFVFRTAGSSPGTTTVDGVSSSVDLFFVCSTARTVRKAAVALRALSRRVAHSEAQRLSDLFWIRLGAAVATRDTLRVVPQLTSLLRRELSQM